MPHISETPNCELPFAHINVYANGKILRGSRDEVLTDPNPFDYLTFYRNTEQLYITA